MKLNIENLQGIPTPFYYYDIDLLKETILSLKKCIGNSPVHVHYAVKANSNPVILETIAKAGFGADCVSGGEIKQALEAGFNPEDISYAGVGKTDDEIRLGLEKRIGCFNAESIEELAIIGEIAADMGVDAPIALRINPNIDAHTHEYITTGLAENKFGIDLRLLDKALDTLSAYPRLRLVGVHCHIGSQITSTEPFKLLCSRMNGIVADLKARGHDIRLIDVGGGFGIDYDNPEAHPVPDFSPFIDTILANLMVDDGQRVIIEPGRSLVAQCGTLVSRVIYVKEGVEKKFVILDAGMSDLLRPALYGACHKIRNLSAGNAELSERYDVVGPICESADVFAKDYLLAETKRGDIFAIYSAGAYGEAMSSNYNSRVRTRSLCS